jgi:HD-like signal output (HDOD) protein
MTRILFVDDESNVLSGLRRMLRPMRKEWQMTFLADGDSALAAMEAEPFEIIVSDIRMPGMDGIELLSRVRRRWPETVRIALSGHADRDATLTAVTEIHQFLSKPCEPESLRAVLTQAVSLNNLLASRELRQTVARMGTLPSLPALFDEMVSELEKPNASLRQIGETIAQDVGMSAKVLQLVNSAFFGLPHRVDSPVQATVLLGLENIRLLVLSVRVFDQFRGRDLGGLELEAMWDHSVRVARMTKRIALAEAANEAVSQRAFLAGLMHDIGKLVLAVNFPQEYRPIASAAPTQPLAAVTAEREAFGATHGELGAYLIGLWGFSAGILDAIARHHEPTRGTTPNFGILTAVHAANVFARNLEPDIEADGHYKLDARYMRQTGLVKRVPLWREMCIEIHNKDTVDERKDPAG